MPEQLPPSLEAHALHRIAAYAEDRLSAVENIGGYHSSPEALLVAEVRTFCHVVRRELAGLEDTPPDRA